MIKFIKNNWIALLMVLLAIASETVWELFDKYQFKVTESGIVTWGDVIYHFIRKLGYLSLVPSIILFYREKVSTSKLIYLGLIFWNVKEVIDRIFYILKNSNPAFSESQNGYGFLFQVVMILTIIVFSFIAYKRCTSFFRFLAHFSWPLYRVSSLIRKRLKEGRD